MEDLPAPKSAISWASALRIGSPTLPANFLLTVLATFLALGLTPALSYVFGSGWFAPLMVALLFFFVLLLFKKFIFKEIYKNAPEDGDAALLEYLVQQNTSGAPGEEEVEMELLENALHLKQVRAHDCMSPRPEIVHIDADASIEQLRELFIESSLSRILVTDGELDRVLGYVHVQQIFADRKSVV